MDDLLENFESFGFSENEYTLLLDSKNEDETTTRKRYQRYLTGITLWQILDYNDKLHDVSHIRTRIVMYLDGDTFYKDEIDSELLFYISLC